MTDADVYLSVRRDLLRYATALIGPGDADDVVSAVVTRALGRPGGLTGLRDAKQYLMRSVLNEVRSRHRRTVRERQLDRSRREEVPGSGDAAVVIEVIASLPPRQRAAAFLVFAEGYTPSEASVLMGCRPGTTRRYLHLARKTLREALDG